MENVLWSNLGTDESGEFDKFYNYMEKSAEPDLKSLFTPIPVEDPYLRKVLIDAAEKMETFLENRAIDIGYRASQTSELGIETDYFLMSKGENKPIIHVFKYRMDMEKWASWLKAHTYLANEGPFTIRNRGIRLTFTGDSAEKYSKLTTSISRKGSSSVGDDNFLDLRNAPPTFVVHRDYFNKKEWVVTQAG